MKLKTLYILAFLVLGTFCLQSCLKDDRGVFDKDASIRLTEYLANAEKVLTDGNATWILEMYPSGDRKYGGYAFTLRFTADSVYCQTELYEDLTVEAGSLWRTTRDDGAVLTIDTYNDFLHYFSTPSSEMYQAFQGEFEWVITKVEQDIITLRGKKTNNIVYLRRMSTAPDQYLSGVLKAEDAMSIVGLEGNIGGVSVKASLDTRYRQIAFRDGENTVETSYAITPEGIRLYFPISILDKTITSLSLNYDEYGTVTSMSTDQGDVLASVLPEGYRKYNDYIGEYTLKYYTYTQNSRGEYVVNMETSADVEIVATGDNSTYLLRGLSPKADIVVKYKTTLGVMEICSQCLGTSGTGEVWLCSWGIASGGSLTAAEQVGMVSVWNGDALAPQYTFVDNGSTSGFETDSFILWKFSETGDSQGALTDRTWMFKNASRITTSDGRFLGNRLPYFNKAILIKR